MLQDVVVKSGVQFKQKNGNLFYFDINRNRWIGVFRENFYFFRNNKNINSNIWLKINEGIPSNINGYIIKKNSIITSVYANCKKSLQTVFKIRKNGIEEDIHNLDLEDKKYKIQDSLNIEINKGDYIQCFMEVNGIIDYPIVGIEIVSRID